MLSMMVSAQPAQAAQTPAFRAEAYAIPIAIRVRHRDGKPHRGLTIADFTILVDGKRRPLVEVKEDADEPARYFLTFQPPDEDRDGGRHHIQIEVKGHPSIKRTIRVPKRR